MQAGPGSGFTPRSTEWFDRFVRETYKPVGAYLLARIGKEEAADALAQVYEIAWNRIDDIPGTPLPWLIGVARNVLRHHWRDEARRARLFERISDGLSHRSADIAETFVQRHTTLTAFQSLGDDDQDLLLLVAWDGLSTSQVAKALGCSQAATAVRLHRARRRFIRALEVECSVGLLDGREPPETAQRQDPPPRSTNAPVT